MLIALERPQSSSGLFLSLYGVCWVCLCCHTPPNSDMDYRIFILCTDVNACDCTPGCTDTERESAVKADWGKKNLAAPGTRTFVSGMMIRCFNQLTYIPSPGSCVTQSCWTQNKLRSMLCCSERLTANRKRKSQFSHLPLLRREGMGGGWGGGELSHKYCVHKLPLRLLKRTLP